MGKGQGQKKCNKCVRKIYYRRTVAAAGGALVFRLVGGERTGENTVRKAGKAGGRWGSIAFRRAESERN